MNNEEISNSVILEEKLASFGALAAVSTVRRSFMNSSTTFKKFDQHHDNDMDIPEKYLKMIG